MYRFFGLGLMVAVLALSVGCKSGSPTSPGGGGGGGGGGTASIEGTYTLIGMEAGGESIPEEFMKKMTEEEKTFKITADKMIATKNGKEDPATYKLDTSKTPHEIDLTSKKDGKEEKMYGIYKLEGDKFTLCAVESDKVADRPKEFKTTKDGKAMIMILKKK